MRRSITFYFFLLTFCFAAAPGWSQIKLPGVRVPELPGPAKHAVKIAKMVKRYDNDEMEMELGRRTAPQVVRDMGGEYHNPYQFRRVSRMTGAILARSQQRRNIQYQVTLVDAPDVNAGALMGGYLFITRGLLAVSNDEELAGVLAHEIAHVELKHGRKQLVEEMVRQQALEAVADMTDNQILLEVGKFLSKLWKAGHSRQHESQSDSYGAVLALRGGFDPLGLISSLWKIAGGPVTPPPRRGAPATPGLKGYVYVPVGRLADGGQPPGRRRGRMRLFDDHPPLDQRIEGLQRQIRSMGFYVPPEGPYFPEDDPDPKAVDPELFGEAADKTGQVHGQGINMCYPVGSLVLEGGATDEPGGPGQWQVPAPGEQGKSGSLFDALSGASMEGRGVLAEPVPRDLPLAPPEEEKANGQ